MAQTALPVICAATADRYRGQEAWHYDSRRQHQERWEREKAALYALLGGASGLVTDVPVGTGRFFPIYREVGFKTVIGYDVSSDMLAQARKAPYGDGAFLEIGDVLAIPSWDKSADWTVCVRLLNLLSEAEMQKAVRELCRVAGVAVVLSIRLGETAWRRRMSITHTHAAFAAAIPQGWSIDGVIDLQDHGYRMVRLRRAQT